jgi:hypothetical protein
MSLSHHPNIVRNGLVFYSDPANPKSYVGSNNLYTSNATLLLDGESLNDKSSYNNTLTNTNVSVSSSQYKFGSNSLYFNGSSRITYPATSGVTFGTGDFTVEGWIYPLVTPTNQYIFDFRNASQTNAPAIGFGLSGPSFLGKFGWYTGSVVIETSSTTPIAASGWSHFAYCRNSNNGSGFLSVNGIVVASGADTTNYTTSPTTSYIGVRYDTTTGPFNGYMDNIAILKGVSLYGSSNFTPPRSTFFTLNTSLDLTKNKNIINYSSGAILDISNGGTISFDGNTGSGVTNSILSVGPTSIFTVCTWAKWNTTATSGGARRPAVGISTVTNSFEFALGFPYTYSSSKLGLEIGKAGVASQIAYSINSAPTGVWYHLAGVYMNGSGSFYLNGVFQNSVIYSATVNSATTASGNWLLATELYNGNTGSNTIGPMNGNVGPTCAYNRILTGNEILQNFNATKARFGY